MLVFPTMVDNERFKREHYEAHVQIFPEGQLVALDGEKVIGTTSSIRLNFDFDHPQHTFQDMIAGRYLTNHDPNGSWLYGVDIGVHPDYRKLGVAKSLYMARQELVQKLGLMGQVTVGLMSGYGAVMDQWSPEEYFEKLKSGEVFDPTVSVQISAGFKPTALIPNYLIDPSCGNFGVLIVWPAK